MPIINLQESDIALGMIISVLHGQRQALPLQRIYAAAERLAPEWATLSPSWRSLLRRALRFLTAKGLVVEVTKGHWKLRDVK